METRPGSVACLHGDCAHAHGLPQRIGAASLRLGAARIGGGGSQRRPGAREVDACALSLGECGRALQQPPAVIDAARTWLDAGPEKYPA
jgi:hypothetical protein